MSSLRVSLATAAILALLAGCPSDVGTHADGSPGDWIAPGDLGDEGSANCYVDPDADSDGDGLLDIYEDLNRNCLVDEGETDPFNPDTDGDGLLDGDEDADGNGVWDEDRGELNPLMIDTDGNGIPDREEPKAAVCNRAHAQRVLGERRVLGPSTTMYVHPDIVAAEPFGFTGAVLLKGREADEGAVIFETKGFDVRLSPVLEVIKTAFHRSGDTSQLVMVGDRDARAYGQILAHLETQEQHFSLEELIAGLSVLAAPLTAPTPNLALFQPIEENLTIQVLASETAKGIRWTIAWKPVNSTGGWFSVVHPRLIADEPTDIIRFVCENVDSLQRSTLDVLVAIEESELAEEVGTSALHAVEFLRVERAKRGLDTRIFTLSRTSDNSVHWQWIPSNLPLADIGVYELATSFGSDPSHLISTALNAFEYTPENMLASLVMFTAPETMTDETSPIQEPLGERAPHIEASTAVVVSLGERGFDCPWEMVDERFESIRRLTEWSDAFHLRACGRPMTLDVSSRVLAPLMGYAWEGTVRDAIWGTISLADGSEDSLPAEVTTIAGQRALVSPDVQKAENSAVSFAAWFPATSR